MGLREDAAADLRLILEDTAAGFGWPITVIDPSRNAVEMAGLSNDISHMIDPQTGIAVTGRLAHVVLSIASLQAAGLEMPRGIADSKSRPWVVQFNDINGTTHKFRVSEAMPDRALGCVKCSLEAFDG